MLEIIGFIAVAVLVIAGIEHLTSGRFNPKDDTDPPNGRSGLKIFTDSKTGLQYIGQPGGPTTPRLDKDGKHMGS